MNRFLDIRKNNDLNLQKIKFHCNSDHEIKYHVFKTHSLSWTFLSKYSFINNKVPLIKIDSVDWFRRCEIGKLLLLQFNVQRSDMLTWPTLVAIFTIYYLPRLPYGIVSSYKDSFISWLDKHVFSATQRITSTCGVVILLYSIISRRENGQKTDSSSFFSGPGELKYPDISEASWE